jgi:hypothetical protein
MEKSRTSLFAEIEKWTEIYEFSFQFWGKGDMNVFIKKGGIDLTSMGGRDTIKEILIDALEWVNKQNPNGFRMPDTKHNHCQGCGAVIAFGIDFCGECMCEDDCGA